MAAKTVGLNVEEWRQLKQIALDRECTLTEAVKFLIERFNTENDKNGNEAGTPDSDAPKPDK